MYLLVSINVLANGYRERELVSTIVLQQLSDIARACRFHIDL